MNELASAKYLKPDSETSTGGSPDAQKPASTADGPLQKCERASRWIGIGASVAIFVAVVAFATPFISRAISTKANSPADWLIRMTTGKSSDQVVGKWLRDRTELNQREIKEKFTSSPTVQFDPTKTMWNGS
jgi:hypothetical protein